MFKLGLTGSIATGKSTVLAAFDAQGVPTFSADEAVHELYAGEAVAPIEAEFRGVSHGGNIDRAELARRLIGKPERLKALEAIVHPLVRQKIAQFLAGAEAQGADLAVVEIPLLYENGVDWGFDAVAVTAVGADEQRRRALARPGMSVEKLDAILARQMPQAEKLKRADYAIDTSVSIAETGAAVAALVARLRRENRAP